MIFQEAVIPKLVFLWGKGYWQIPKDLLKGRDRKGFYFFKKYFP